jgi:hypothetical protein
VLVTKCRPRGHSGPCAPLRGDRSPSRSRTSMSGVGSRRARSAREAAPRSRNRGRGAAPNVTDSPAPTIVVSRRTVFSESRASAVSRSSPRATVTAPADSPWSWRSMRPPWGHAMTQASKVSDAAMRSHTRCWGRAMPGQRWAVRARSSAMASSALQPGSRWARVG